MKCMEFPKLASEFIRVGMLYAKCNSPSWHLSKPQEAYVCQDKLLRKVAASVLSEVETLQEENIVAYDRMMELRASRVREIRELQAIVETGNFESKSAIALCEQVALRLNSLYCELNYCIGICKKAIRQQGHVSREEDFKKVIDDSIKAFGEHFEIDVLYPLQYPDVFRKLYKMKFKLDGVLISKRSQEILEHAEKHKGIGFIIEEKNQRILDAVGSAPLKERIQKASDITGSAVVAKPEQQAVCEAFVITGMDAFWAECMRREALLTLLNNNLSKIDTVLSEHVMIGYLDRASQMDSKIVDSVKDFIDAVQCALTPTTGSALTP